MPVGPAQDINDRSHIHRACPLASHFSDPLGCRAKRNYSKEKERERDH